VPKLLVKLGSNPLSVPVVTPGVAIGVEEAPSLEYGFLPNSNTACDGTIPNGYIGLPKELVPLGAGNAIL
jgi:hypothetical protein